MTKVEGMDGEAREQLMNERKMQKLKNKHMDASPVRSPVLLNRTLSVADKVLTDNGSGENQYCGKSGRKLRIKQREALAPVTLQKGSIQKR